MDPIADMFTTIRNALSVDHKTVRIPFSKFKYEIAKILEREGFLEKVERKGKKVKKMIEITLKYKGKIPAILGLRKVSKQGQQIYSGFRNLTPVKSGYGLAIVSTSKGLMTDKEAKKKKIGGELICEIW